jgi:Kef-type K+ transport system membrane component KefB
MLFYSIAGKLGGCTIAARFSGLSWREAVVTGIFMNAKGLVELIVLNTGEPWMLSWLV